MGEVGSRVVRWLPVGVVLLAQMVIAANLTTLDVSIGAIVADFPTATTYVQSAIVICSLITAAMMILSGRAGAMYGSLPMFRGGVLLLGVGMAGVALSRGPAMLIVAEAVAGAATAALAPTFVALVTASYHGRQRTLAIGALGVAGTAIALLLAGMLGTALGWRVPFWIMVAVATLVLVASRCLAPSPKQAGVTIDWLGVLLSATGILVLTVGINGIAAWGLLLAKDAAPFELFGISPSLPLVIVGLGLIWVFFKHQRHHALRGEMPLLSPEVVAASAARRASAGLLVTVAVSGGSWYLLPLYMQVIQGYDAGETAIAMLPYALSMSCSALLVARLPGRLAVSRIARMSMLLMTSGLLILGLAIDNNWGNAIAVLGLLILGTGQGAVLTVVSNVLIGASRPALSGDAGALRGTVYNLGSAIGTAVAGALLITLLGTHVQSEVTASSGLPADLKSRLKLENVQFISNQQLESEASHAGLSEAEVQEAVRINTQARLTALRQAFFALAVLAAIGAILAGGLPQAGVGKASLDQENEF